MCEIAILRAAEYDTGGLYTAALEVYSAMGDSIGLVHMEDVGDRFVYDTHKSVDFDESAVTDFLTGIEDGLVFIHGRLATHGDVCAANAHPLDVPCEQCEANMVMHNGVVTQWRSLKKQHQYDEHEYATDVDSEAIAHEQSTIPDELSECVSPFPNQPAYILFSDTKVYIAASRYQLTADGQMAHSYRNFGPGYNDKSYAEVLLRPSEVTGDD